MPREAELPGQDATAATEDDCRVPTVPDGSRVTVAWGRVRADPAEARRIGWFLGRFGPSEAGVAGSALLYRRIRPFASVEGPM
jgi:hypothetical protein